MKKANNAKRFFTKKKNKPSNVFKYGLYLERWALKYLKTTMADGYCVGVSGGIDSALAVAILSKIPCRLMTAFIDIESSPQDKIDAQKVCDKFEQDLIYINLTSTYKSLVKDLKLEKSANAKANLKSRLRAVTLYALANRNNLLTCGTSNADERLVGYFTKFGDSACDIMLLCQLLKSHVRYLAKQYGVPESIIDKKPSAGLTENQTDEKDMGITYDEIDHYLCWATIDPIQESKINTRIVANKHKLKGPAQPKKFLILRNSK